MVCIPLFERYEKRKSRNFFLAHTLQKPKFAEKNMTDPYVFASMCTSMSKRLMNLSLLWRWRSLI